jgi:hypothetical protein
MKTRTQALFLTLALPALMLAGCGGNADLDACRARADAFMQAMARGDFNGAYELCDPAALNFDGLRTTRNAAANDAVFENFRGLRHGSGGHERATAGFREIQLPPAEVSGAPGYRLHFAFRHYDEGWRIIGFRIERPD